MVNPPLRSQWIPHYMQRFLRGIQESSILHHAHMTLNPWGLLITLGTGAIKGWWGPTLQVLFQYTSMTWTQPGMKSEIHNGHTMTQPQHSSFTKVTMGIMHGEMNSTDVLLLRLLSTILLLWSIWLDLLLLSIVLRLLLLLLLLLSSIRTILW